LSGLQKTADHRRLDRVEELADRAAGIIPKKSYPFQKLVELDKIIASAFGVKSRSSKKVQTEYDKLIKIFGSELYILMDLPLAELVGKTSPLIAEGIKRVREGKLEIKPGFDGQYGEIKIFTAKEKIPGTRKSVFFKICSGHAKKHSTALKFWLIASIPFLFFIYNHMKKRKRPPNKRIILLSGWQFTLL